MRLCFSILSVVILVSSCATTKHHEPVSDELPRHGPYTIDDVSGYANAEFRTAAAAGEPVFVAVKGLPDRTSHLASGMTEAHLASIGFSIVESNPDEVLLDRLLNQLETPYESGNSLRLGQWLQSNYFALVSFNINRQSPAVSPSDTRNFYSSPQSGIVVYNLSTREKIAAVNVINFRSNVQTEESTAVRQIVEEIQKRITELVR